MVNELWYACLIIAFETFLLVFFAWKAFDSRFHPLLIAALLACLQCVRRSVMGETGVISLIPTYGLDLAAVCLCFSGRLQKKIFLLAFFYALIFIFDVAAILLVTSIYELIFANTIDSELLHILATIVSRLMLICVILIIGRSLREENSLSDWLRFVPMPALTVLAISWLHSLPFEATDKSIVSMLTAVCVFGLLSNIFVLAYIKSANERMRLDYRLQIMEENKGLRKKHIQELQSAYRQIERTGHDMKNHLSYIENAPDIESVRKYVQEIKGRSSSQIFEFTGNFDVDTILNAKRHEMKKIRMNVSGTLPAHIEWLDPVDVSIILGNALDNAIEACERCNGREIAVSFTYDKCLVITVENPTDRKPVPKRYGAGFVSSKGKGHGIGMESMETALARYDGHMETEVTDGIFRLGVLLQELLDTHGDSPEHR